MKPPCKAPEGYLPAADYARLHNIHPSTLLGYCATGRLEHLRIRKWHFIPENAKVQPTRKSIPDGCLTTTEYCARHGMSLSRVKAMLKAGLIEGARWTGQQWLLPEEVTC